MRIWGNFSFFIGLKPRVEWFKNVRALNTSPPWKHCTFLERSYSQIEVTSHPKTGSIQNGQINENYETDALMMLVKIIQWSAFHDSTVLLRIKIQSRLFLSSLTSPFVQMQDFYCRVQKHGTGHVALWSLTQGSSSRFAKVNSHPNPFTYHLYRQKWRISWRICGGVRFCKTTLKTLCVR